MRTRFKHALEPINIYNHDFYDIIKKYILSALIINETHNLNL